MVAERLGDVHFNRLLALAWLLLRLALSRRQGRGLRTLDALASSFANATRAFVIDRAHLRFLWTSPPLGRLRRRGAPFALRDLLTHSPPFKAGKTQIWPKASGKSDHNSPRSGQFAPSLSMRSSIFPLSSLHCATLWFRRFPGCYTYPPRPEPEVGLAEATCILPSRSGRSWYHYTHMRPNVTSGDRSLVAALEREGTSLVIPDLQVQGPPTTHDTRGQWATGIARQRARMRRL
jgi:hypothetical protein